MLSWDEVIEQGALLMERSQGSAVYIPADAQKRKVSQGFWFANPQPELPNYVRPEIPEWAKKHTSAPSVTEDVDVRQRSNAGKPYSGKAVAPQPAPEPVQFTAAPASKSKAKRKG